MRDVVFIWTNKDHDRVVEQYEKFKSELSSKYDVFVVYDKTANPLPDRYKGINNISINTDVYDELGISQLPNDWAPDLIKEIYNGKTLYYNEFMPMLKMFAGHNEYDYYWYLEDDVRFNGNWSLLFDYFYDKPYDFISTSMRRFANDPYCALIPSLRHPSKNIANEEIIMSFNIIYRISNRGLKFLMEELHDGWEGHHEVLIPTLLNKGGFSIADFGGKGYRGDNSEFIQTDKHFYNKTIDGVYYNTCDWLPRTESMPITITDVIYHPVKDFF